MQLRRHGGGARREPPEIPQGGRINMHGDQQFITGVADGMHRGVLPGGDGSGFKAGFVFQVDIPIGRDRIVSLDGLAADGQHRADRSAVIVRHARLAGKPGHDQHLVLIAQRHRRPVVVVRIGMHMIRHIGGGDAGRFQSRRQVDQRRFGAKAVEFEHQLVEPIAVGVHADIIHQITMRAIFSGEFFVINLM
jgi:hypothetical protein